jgi:hypothetical protein
MFSLAREGGAIIQKIHKGQRPPQLAVCVPKIRFGVDGASGRRKLAS